MAWPEKSKNVEIFGRSVFIQNVNRRKNVMNDISVVKIVDNLRTWRVKTKLRIFTKVSGARNYFQKRQMIYLTVYQCCLRLSCKRG